jgi:hypothetical protein
LYVGLSSRGREESEKEYEDCKMKLELTDEEFTLIRLSVANSLGVLAEADEKSLKTLIKKFTEELLRHQPDRAFFKK